MSERPRKHPRVWVHNAHVSSSHGHPFSCKYFKHPRWPRQAAAAHVSASNGHPFSCKYFTHTVEPERFMTSNF